MALNGPMSAVFFDFDGTLVFHEPDSFDLIYTFCADIGQPLNAERERQGRRTRLEYFVDPAVRERLNALSEEGFWNHFNHQVLEAIGIEGDLDQLAAQITLRYMDLTLTYHCPAAGFRTLSCLRARGYRLGLITNRENPERFHELVDQMELRGQFEVIVASGELGVRKPEPGIFHAALDRIGATAAQSLYVGDNYWADVVGAERAGMTPVLLDPYRIFPEAECLVLERIDELLVWLPEESGA
jgi:HAD superfamily hydrolase (TIGR01662 family)